MLRARVAFVVAALAASVPTTLGGQSSAPAASQQSPDSPPVFRSGVQFVRFDAFVTDGRGEPVAGLTPADFEVYEDGTLQTIQQFSPVVIPAPRGRTLQAISRSARPPADVTANDEGQDRIYVIVFNSLNWQESVRATQMVRRFLDDHFGDSDLAAVVTLDRPGPMRFTNDRTLLIREADSFVSRFVNASPGARSRGGALERATVFGNIATALGHIEARRKSIIFISGTQLEFDPYDAIDNSKSSFTEEARAAMEPIMAGNLTVYPIYPGEVAGPLEMGTLRALAYVTGGTPAGTDINKAFRQVVRDNSTYYVVGYESTNTQRDGGFRKIQVRTRRPDLKVRARDGYFVEFPTVADPNRLFSFDGRRPVPRSFTPRSDFTPEMTRALASPVVLTDVPMRVFATPRKAGPREPNISIVVEIPASGLGLTMKDETVTGTIDLVVGATTGQRTLRGDGFTYDIAVRSEARDQLLRNGMRLTADVALEPGDYRLHVAAGWRGGRTGKVFYDLTVPDFTRPLLALGGVLLTSSAASETVTFQDKSVRATELPEAVTASRDFPRTETVNVYAEIYENVWWTDSDHLVSLTTELRAENGEAIPMTSEARTSKAPRRAGGGYGFVARLPLAAVPPGSYELRIEARSDFNGTRTVTRDVPIRVY
jgi:VWFA-related protein